MKLNRKQLKSPKINVKKRIISVRAMPNLKKSKSYMASVKLMSKKIRYKTDSSDKYTTLDEAQKPNDITDYLDENISHEFYQKMKLAISPIKKNNKIKKINKKKVKNKYIDENNIPDNNKNIYNDKQIFLNKKIGYENPTFTMDQSLDSSLTNYLFEPIATKENGDDDYDDVEDEDDDDDNNNHENKSVINDNKNQLTSKGGQSKLSIVFGEPDSIITKNALWCDKLNKIDTNIINNINDKSIKFNDDQKKDKNNYDSENMPGLSWFTNRATSFRWKYNRDDTSKLQSYQGMDFLEGLSKKKQQQNHHHYHRHNQNFQHQQYLKTGTINPLTAQSSLNIHLHALFTAIEHGNLEKIKTILETADVDINSVNSDGLSPLDIAVLSNNKALIKILIAHGSQEGNEYKTTECLGSHLRSMLLSVEQRLGEMGGNSNNGTLGTSGALFLDAGSTRASFSAAHNNLTGCGGNAEEKQVALWERRIGTLRKLVKSFDQTKPPDVPLCVNISVIGSKSVMIELQDTENDESYACTKFKIQWSFDDDFSIIAGEKQVLNMKKKECQIDGLIQGKKYYFRACCGNLKGYSQFLLSSPPYVVPSSWRDIDGQIPRFSGRLEKLDELFNDIKRPEYSQDTPALQRRNHKKKTTIKQLFTATSKFQKILRRGVYLTCLIYHEDKVLVTNEDFLPVIEVDETYPSCIYNDFHWLMKVSCTWDDIKILKQDMERSNGSPANHFRLKLLQAAAQMQTALCIQDLGQVYYKPIRDIQGTLVFSTINYIKSPKLVSVLNSRWLPLNKVMKKLVIHEDSNVADILMASIQDQMTYHQLSSIKLTKGLYLGYLKMQSSVDLIQVVVPTKAPNSLPHFKIRDNCHVSAEEWDYLKKIKINYNELTNNYNDNEINNNNKDEIIDNNKYKYANEQQRLFIDNVASTARRLFSYMEINNDESLNHRLYDAEVIELSDEVSFLIIVPPAETACSVPGTREILLQRGDLLSLPIQVFEMVHLLAYQKNVIKRYSRLSCILELDTIHAQHNHREAFSTIELTEAKNKLAKLEKFQTQMNTIWKGARWLIDVITFARDRQTTSGISIKYLLNIERNNKTNGLKRTLLQLPSRDTKVVKSSPGRGSWPGPNISIINNNNNNNNNIINSGKKNLLITEFSKSEQHLTTDILTNDCRSRKASDTSNFSTGSEPTKPTSLFIDDDDDDDDVVDNNDPGSLIKHSSIMPPSKSEDTLLINKYSNSSSINTAGVTSGLSLSASTSPQFYVKPLVYGNALLSDSDSLQSVNSDEISGVSNLHQHLTGTNKKKIKDKTLKIKNKKPTASVAAMASNLLLSSTSTSSLPPMNTHIDDIKDQMASSTSTSTTTTTTTTTMPAPMPGILQVFAAYDTGLAAGTSLKLHVTPRTTAREVVDLVVKQLNMAVVLKGQEGPIYTADELPNFCLVAVIGARERCLRDDFKPLQLQNPWKKGRLYVRLKQDVLAALEHSSKLTAYL